MAVGQRNVDASHQERLERTNTKALTDLMADFILIFGGLDHES